MVIAGAEMLGMSKVRRFLSSGVYLTSYGSVRLLAPVTAALSAALLSAAA